MRRPLLLIAASILASCPFACVTSSDTPKAQEFDASTYDAALPDTQQPPLPDGALPEAAPDAPIDASPGVVTIAVTKSGAPEQGIAVIFHDAAGALVTTLTTDATGRASRTVDADAQVSVLLGGPGGRKIVTVVGVKNGDVITVPDLEPPSSVMHDIAVDLPGAQANAADYEVKIGGCAGLGSASTLTVPVTLYPGCWNAAGKFPVLAHARDQVSTPLAYAYKKGNALAADAGADGGDAGPLAVSGLSAWSTGFGSDVIQLSNAPANASNVALVYNEIADEVPSSTATFLDVARGVTNAAYTAHRGYADAIQPQLNAMYATPGSAAMTSWAKRQAAPTADATITYDASQLLPALLSVTLDKTTLAQPLVSWTSAASLGATDGGVLRLTWYNMLEAGIEGGGWTIVLPPSATSARAPQLPASAAAWLPIDPTTIQPPQLGFVETDLLPGYDALRAIAPSGTFSPDLPYLDPSIALPPLPANGTLRLTLWGLPPG